TTTTTTPTTTTPTTITTPTTTTTPITTTTTTTPTTTTTTTPSTSTIPTTTKTTTTPTTSATTKSEDKFITSTTVKWEKPGGAGANAGQTGESGQISSETIMYIGITLGSFLILFIIAVLVYTCYRRRIRNVKDRLRNESVDTESTNNGGYSDMNGYANVGFQNPMYSDTPVDTPTSPTTSPPDEPVLATPAPSAEPRYATTLGKPCSVAFNTRTDFDNGDDGYATLSDGIQEPLYENENLSVANGNIGPLEPLKEEYVTTIVIG
ncbi:integumentary mucin C.1-like, partial [Lingula anatina]|uniref:Integumentary mucin C.1-like n=1 Tax=Lingula anatina TaxID=7574 RepID=A0A2R2MP22_LINAN